MKERKAFLCMMIGTLIIGSATVYAAATNRKVEAWLTDDIKLFIGGSNELSLPEGVHILNYEDRIYLPMRFVAEQMGGSVYYDADNARVAIATAPPVIETIEVEKPVEPTVAPEHAPAVPQYNKYPVRMKYNDVTINITGITRAKDRTYIDLDILNENIRFASLDFNKAYIEVDGVKYKTIFEENFEWGTSIQPSEELEDRMLIFQAIPSSESKMIIVLPVIIDTYDSSVGMTEQNHPFTFYIEFN